MPNSLVDVITLNLYSLWGDVIAYVPQILVAIVVLIIGWIIGAALMRVVVRLFEMFKINQALGAAGFDDLAERAGHKFNAGTFVGKLVKWFVIIVFIVAALEILNLDQVTFFLRDVVLGYLPKVIVAVLILLGSLVVANLASTSVEAAARAGNFHAADLLGTVTRWAIIVFAVLAALSQLEIAPELVQMLFAGIVFATALALGLAFGLGGREWASRMIERMSRGGRGGME